jgi:AraC-like DNA-binding protein
MPSAPTIRKQILVALNEGVIPQLQTQAAMQLLAAPPFCYNFSVVTVERKALLPNIRSNPLNVVSNLDGAELGTRRIALLGVSYSGASIERVGVTRRMGKELKQHKLPVPAGITAFRLTSPGVLYVPSQVPHSGSSLSTDNEVHRMLLMWFSDQELWVNRHDAAAGGTHNLNISEPAFHRMKDSYVRCLEKREFNVAQSVLLEMMRQLSAYLSSHEATINNTAWPPFEEKSILIAPHVSARNARYCHQVMDYVQFHLNTPLSLEVLAAVCGITVPHLSTLFRRSTGISLMNYVTLHRLRAAEMMLLNGKERISDIAQLTGFADSHSFAGAFRRRHGMSASTYRRKKSRIS